MNNNSNQPIIRKPNCWHRRSQLEKIFIGVIAALIGIILALLVVIDYHVKPDTCTTPTCLVEASSIAASLNENVDPCDDFYEFACGNYIKNARIPNNEVSVGRSSSIQNHIWEQIRDMLDDLGETTIRPFEMVKVYYEVCKNTTALNLNGLNTIKQIIKLKLGGWPVLEDDWHEHDFDWMELIYKFRHLGFNINGIVSTFVHLDYNDTSKHIVWLSQAELGFYREFLIKGTNDSEVKSYYEYMVDVAVIFGADKQKARQELAESLEFEMKLAKISLPEQKFRDPNAINNVFTMEQLQQHFTTIPWFLYINNLVANKSSTLHKYDTVNVEVPTYFKELEILLRQTPKRTLANYLIWHAIKSLDAYINDEISNRRQIYHIALAGRTERSPRWQECLFQFNGLNSALSALFVRKYLKQTVRESAKEMVEEIRYEFKNRLHSLDWMDDVTRHYALQKLEAMTETIGFPDEFLDDQVLIEHYKNLEIDPENYFLSVTNLSLFSTNYYFAQLERKEDKSNWLDMPKAFYVNSYNYRWKNRIVINAAELLDPEFNSDRPRYLNFATLGFTIGHEIIHSFDNEGRQFDKNGNVMDWWSPTAKANFLKKAQCIIEQYGNYTVPEVNINLNGFYTQGENIADNVGVNLAYLAYNKWVAKTSQEKTLPGLNYTQNQLFWISFANMYCSKSRPNTIRQWVETNSHSEDRFRIIGTVSNNEHFADDFNCPLGSQMNPINKCSIW